MELEEKVKGQGKRLKKELAEVIVSMEGYYKKRPSLGDLLEACETRLKGKNHRFFDKFSEQDCKVIKHFLNDQLSEIKAQEARALSAPIDNNFESEEDLEHKNAKAVEKAENGGLQKPAVSTGATPGLAGKAEGSGSVSNPQKPSA